MKILFLSLLFASLNWITPSLDYSDASIEYTAMESKGPDLVVESITITHRDCGESALWSVVICNNGVKAAPATTVDLQFEPCPFEFTYDSYPVIALAPQTCILISGEYGSNCKNLGITADVDPQDHIYESDEFNNYVSGFATCQ